MSGLPRPVKDVLAEPALDASVMRVWAKISLKRRVPPPMVRPTLAFAGALALVAFVVTVWPSKRVLSAPAVELAETPAPVRRAVPPAPHARRPMMVSLGRPVTAAEPETDVVGALFLSVEDAAREGRTEQVVAILGEIAQHHTDDERVTDALLRLGSIQLEVLKRPELALESFRRALELHPPDDLVPELWERYEAARDRSRVE